MTVRESLTGLDVATKRRIERDFQKLRVEFEDALGPAAVERCLEEALSAVPDGKVKEYVPLLAHRYARERLKEMAEESRN